ncbi:MAG: hypothetical protein FJ276_16620 [Planctomycetes bacterium]|nr:hypothetical protein [Planctomycetota bacterium]
MVALRIMFRSLVASATVLGAASAASAQGLVGVYVYPHAWGRGLVIAGFVPGSSADQLRMRGELYIGDIITRYDGRRVSSAYQIRWISSMYPRGTWLRMDFLTPCGQPFWHWVQPGGGAAVCAVPGMGHGRIEAPQTFYQFRKGMSRPRTHGSRPGRSRHSSMDLPPGGPIGLDPGLPVDPGAVDGPEGPGDLGHPIGPEIPIGPGGRLPPGRPTLPRLPGEHGWREQLGLPGFGGR